MKKILLIGLLVGFTSCYDFNREQNELDAESNGRAILLEAESSKKAMIEEAKANSESATIKANAKIKIAEAEAEARIIKAESIAKANEIISESIENRKALLEYEYIQAIRYAKGTRIYVPTEAGLPIYERK